MAQITIEVPDILAERLTSVKERLSELLTRELEQPPPLSNEVYRYILAFLATNPSPEAILQFSLTPAMQERAEELLEKNRAGQLTPAETTELDEYVHINDLVSLLKAQAFKTLRSRS
jgi:hypothetical protein